MTDGQPLRHIARTALPWAAGDPLTVCGRDPADVAAWATWDDARAYAAKHGKTRTYLSHCVTCVDRCDMWRRDFATDPIGAVAAALEGLRHRGRNNAAARRRTELELHALAALVERHRDEFAALAAEQPDVPRLADHRRRR